jgi:hypothetical protein
MDYEKLKRAHELVSNLKGYHLIVEELLEALEELNKPKPKFQPGETVWYLIIHNRGINIVNDIVKKVEYKPKNLGTKKYFIIYVDGKYIYEDFAFKTKKELIDYQCSYWNKKQGELNV